MHLISAVPKTLYWRGSSWLLAFSVLLIAGKPAWGEEWRILDGDAEALEARIHLIRLAERDISLACFNSDSGFVITQIASAMVARVRQGVRVRFLVDGLPSVRTMQRLQWLASQGIEVKLFHPVGLLRPRWLNRRLHSKIMLCDDMAMILGSRNLTDPHFGLSKDNFIDSDYLIFGELSRCGRQYFERLWNYEGSVTVQKVPGLRVDDVPAVEMIPGKGEVSPRIGSVASGDIELVFDQDIDKSTYSFEDQLVSIIHSASSEIIIETPYPALSTKFQSALLQASRRGVSVCLFTNSATNTDKASTYAALQNQKRSLLRAGIQIREYRGEGCIHAKSIVIDRSMAWVGSYNFDPRGDRLNLELCLQVTDRTFVDAIIESIDHRNSCSSKATPAVLRLDATAPLSKRAKIRGLQLLAPLLKPSL